MLLYERGLNWFDSVAILFFSYVDVVTLQKVHIT